MEVAAAQAVDAAPLVGLNPTYDEQAGLTITQDMPALAYNVTALAQNDANGYGPAYLLNGLTPAGYWYQVGISYHWPTSEGVGYDPTFGFSYQVYGSNGKPVYPQTGGAGLSNFSAPVNSGDIILLSLTFSGSVVDMAAQDWNTSAVASTSYSDMGVSTFVGTQSAASTSQGYFSGLMTEWYHLSSYSANEGKVTYTDKAVGLSSAWLWVDEFDITNPSMPLFSNATQAPVSFIGGQQVYSFASDGITMYATAHSLITGLLNVSASMVSLSPAPQSTKTASSSSSSPSLTVEANYTLTGLRQSSQMTAGKSLLIEADPGTSITISLNASGSSTTDRWVFAGTWESPVTTVTFTVGSNVTFVYYHLVEETVAFAVANGGTVAGGGGGEGGGAPPSSSAAPELTYEEPPAAASSTADQVAAVQPLGTTPVEIFAVQGSEASLSVAIPGTTDERWTATTQNWTISSPNTIPNPIQLYHQYEVSIVYSIVGGGTPASSPKFNSTSLGAPDVISLSGSEGSTTTAWLDAGSSYSFSGVLKGSTSGERWLNSGENSSSSSAQQSVVASPGEKLDGSYIHQYYADLEVNDQQGGSVSPGSGWLNAGSTLRATALPATGWRFETWNGSGNGFYTGSSQTLQVVIAAPIAEEASFYVQVSISADSGTNVAYSFGSITNGTVHAGSTDVVAAPPASRVSLRATPALPIYSFYSWKGTEALANATRSSTSFVVTAPSSVTATSSYDYQVLLGLGVALGIVVVLLLAFVRSLRMRGQGRVRAETATGAGSNDTAASLPTDSSASRGQTSPPSATRPDRGPGVRDGWCVAIAAVAATAKLGSGE
jgi:hypothetical protein